MPVLMSSDVRRAVTLAALLPILAALLVAVPSSAQVAPAEGTVRVTVMAPKGVAATAVLNKKSARFTVTKSASVKSRTILRKVATGTWRVSAPPIEVDGRFYVAIVKPTTATVRSGKTVKVSVVYMARATVRDVEIVDTTADSLEVSLVKPKAATPIRVRFAKGTKPPSTVRRGTAVKVGASTTRSMTVDVNYLEPTRTYTVAVFTKVGTQWVGPASVTAATTASTTQRVSTAPDGTPANGGSWTPAISADGRYITYHSGASNLVPGDTNDASDVFVWDRTTGTTQRVSTATDGTQSNRASSAPTVSADGRYITYASGASNLVPGDTNHCDDIFVWDRTTGTTQRVSTATDGTQANRSSGEPAISADGRYITYTSGASNLVPGDTKYTSDVFVWDRTTGTTQRVSTATDGTQSNSDSWHPAISGDGRYITYETSSVFVWDRTTGTTQRVSTAADGTQANGASGVPAISADGRYISYISSASNLVPGDTNNAHDVFVWDQTTGTTQRVSAAIDGTQSNAESWMPAISGDGRYITYTSSIPYLIPGSADRFLDLLVWDRTTDTTQRVLTATDRIHENNHSSSPAISADGRYITYDSSVSNLVRGDTNDRDDVFVWSRDEAPD